MADLKTKTAGNIPGPYYVDDTCIDCDLCRSLFPAFFRRDDNDGLTFVYRQPINADEIGQAEEARLSCPYESIGNDGLLEGTR